MCVKGRNPASIASAPRLCAPQLSGQVSDIAVRAQHHRCNSEIFAVLQSQVMLRRTGSTEPADAHGYCGAGTCGKRHACKRLDGVGCPAFFLCIVAASCVLGVTYSQTESQGPTQDFPPLPSPNPKFPKSYSLFSSLQALSPTLGPTPLEVNSAPIPPSMGSSMCEALNPKSYFPLVLSRPDSMCHSALNPKYEVCFLRFLTTLVS